MSQSKKTVRVTLTLPDGTRKYFSGSTREEAEEKRDKAKLRIFGGLDMPENIMFKAYAEAWLADYKAKTLSTKTIECAENAINNHIIPALGSFRLVEIKPFHIDRMLTSMSGYSKSLQQKALVYSNAIFNRAIENDIILKSPTFGKKPIAKAPKKVHALTEDQCVRLLAATKGTRVYPFIVVLLYCGLRRGEALGLMWKDIDFQNNMLHVNRSILWTNTNHAGEINADMKSEAAQRSIPMSQEVVSVLKELKAESKSPYVFSMKNGKFLSETSFRRMWDLVRDRSVVCIDPSSLDRKLVKPTLDFDVHPHQLRHTCCTRWIASGMNPKAVQYLMGHSTVDLTMQVYAEFQASEHMKDAINVINPDNPISAAK